MDWFFAFAPTLATSLAASLFATALLVSHFRFDESIMLFAGLITAFAIISIVAFGLAHGRVQSSSGLLKVAIGLAVATLVLAAIPGGVDRITLHTSNPYINLNDRGGDIRFAGDSGTDRNRHAMDVGAAKLAARTWPRNRMAMDYERRPAF